MKKNILTILFAAQVFVGISQAYIRYSDTINFEEPCSYLYIDYLGKMIESETFIGEPVLLNTKSYKNGIYFYKLIKNTDKKTSRGKFLLKK